MPLDVDKQVAYWRSSSAEDPAAAESLARRYPDPLRGPPDPGEVAAELAQAREVLTWLQSRSP